MGGIGAIVGQADSEGWLPELWAILERELGYGPVWAFGAIAVVVGGGVVYSYVNDLEMARRRRRWAENHETTSDTPPVPD